MNKKFSYPPKEQESRFVPLDDVDLSNILCIRVERRMLSGNVVSYINYYYKILDEDKKDKQIYKGTIIMIYENVLTKLISIKYRKKFYYTKLVPGHRIDSKKENKLKKKTKKF